MAARAARDRVKAQKDIDAEQRRKRLADAAAQRRANLLVHAHAWPSTRHKAHMIHAGGLPA